MPAIAGSRRQSPVTSWLLKALLCATSLGSNDSLEASQQQSVKEEGDSTAVSRTASKQFPSKQEALDVLKAWKTGHPELVTSPRVDPQSNPQVLESPESSSPQAAKQYAPERSQLSRAWSVSASMTATASASPAPPALGLSRAASAAASSCSSSSTEGSTAPQQLLQQHHVATASHSTDSLSAASSATPTASVIVASFSAQLRSAVAAAAPTVPATPPPSGALPSIEEQRWSFRDVEQAMGVDLSFSLPSGANVQAWACAGGPRNPWDTTCDDGDDTLLATYWKEADRVLGAGPRNPPSVSPFVQVAWHEDTLQLPEHGECSTGSSLYEFELGDMCDLIDAGHTSEGEGHTPAPPPASGSFTGSYHPVTCLSFAEMPNNSSRQLSRGSSSPFSIAAAAGAPGADVEYSQPGYTFLSAGHSDGTGGTPKGTPPDGLPRIPSCSLPRAHSACRTCVIDMYWPDDVDLDDSSYHQGACVLSGDNSDLTATASVHQLSSYRMALSAPLPAMHRPHCFRCSPRCSIGGCQGTTIMSAV